METVSEEHSVLIFLAFLCFCVLKWPFLFTQSIPCPFSLYKVPLVQFHHFCSEGGSSVFLQNPGYLLCHFTALLPRRNKQKVKIIVLYFLIYRFLDRNHKKYCGQNDVQKLQSSLNFIISVILICYCNSQILEVCHIY